jgi:hypothetical protein
MITIKKKKKNCKKNNIEVAIIIFTARDMRHGT